MKNHFVKVTFGIVVG